jgi:drug/metabolite transporter (DMT)-like permease
VNEPRAPIGASAASRLAASTASSALAWYFAVVWSAGCLATKAGRQYAAPFTFLALRFAIGIAVSLPILVWLEPHWPVSPMEWEHVIIAGLVMHAIHLSGSHYAQYLGMSAGFTAILLASQPLLTAVIATFWLGESPTTRQWMGVMIGLGGVAMIVWHKLDIAAVSIGSLIAVMTAWLSLTVGTLYQRKFCAFADLRWRMMIQFAVCLAVLTPLSFAVQGAAVRWSWTLILAILFLVVFTSILAADALHTLLRRGEAAHVSSMLFLPAVVAVVLEWWLFGVVPTLVSLIGVVVTSIRVALAAKRS